MTTVDTTALDTLLRRYNRCCCRPLPFGFDDWDDRHKEDWLRLKLRCCGSISGVVTINGTPTAGVEVVLTKPDASEETRTTNADGWFKFCGLICGEYEVVTTDPAADSHSFTVSQTKRFSHDFEIVV